MNSEAKNLARITGAGTGVGLAAGTDQDWLQIAGIVIAALSTLLPLLQKMFAKKDGGNSGAGVPPASAVLALLFFLPGCATTLNQGDVALLSQDLRDLAREGTIYALAENPEWRPNIIVVRDQLHGLATTTNLVSFNSLLLTLQGLPVKELKTSEARLAITAASITLRRVGRNVELGNIANLQPLAGGLDTGISEGLDFEPIEKRN